MGEAAGREEKGRPDTKPFRKSCDTSKIWMWQWLDNTQYPLTSPTASKYEQSDGQGEAIEIFHRCFDFMLCDVLLWTETQRGIQKGARGRSEVLSRNKNKTRARIAFSRPRSLKEKYRCTQRLRVWKSLIYQLLPKLCPSIGFTRPGQRRRYQCFRYLSSDLQHPAVKRVLLL